MALISIVVPARNESANIPRLEAELKTLRARLPEDSLEILVVDNDSDDDTGRRVVEVCGREPNWRYIKFSRNFGSEASIAAGLRHAKGDAVIILFSDLQDPPDRIPDFIAKWKQGYKIVYGRYSGTSHERFLKRFLVSGFYRVIRSLSESPMEPYVGDFQLYDREVVNALVELQERNRYMRGLSQWVGFPKIAIDYERRPRTAGKSKAPLLYMFNFALSVIINFSAKPLRFILIFGVITGFCSLLLTGLLLYNYLIGNVVPGLTTTHVLLTVNLAFMAFGMGIIGEYVAKIYKETQRRPMWIIERTVGYRRPARQLENNLGDEIQVFGGLNSRSSVDSGHEYSN